MSEHARRAIDAELESRGRRENIENGLVAAVLNLPVLLVLTALYWGSNSYDGNIALIFVCGELLASGLYYAVPRSSRWGSGVRRRLPGWVLAICRPLARLASMLGTLSSAGSRGLRKIGDGIFRVLRAELGALDGDEEAETDDQRKRRLRSVTESLWWGAVVNLAAVAFLVYHTGGPTASPLQSLPLMMIVTGQILVTTERLDVKRRRGRLLRILGQMVRRYRYSLLCAIGVYAVLFWLRPHPPDEMATAPWWEHAIVLALDLAVTTFVTFVDRSSAAGEPRDQGAVELGGLDPDPQGAGV